LAKRCCAVETFVTQSEDHEEKKDDWEELGQVPQILLRDRKRLDAHNKTSLLPNIFNT
jgi:hypothetical protein